MRGAYLTAAALLALVGSRSGAQEGASVTEPIRVDEEIVLELRQVYVTVTRSGGERALDLGRDAFRVFDEGRLQELVTFESGDVPFTAVLLIDGSESMSGTRLRAAEAGARAFVAGMRAYDETKLMVFSDVLLSATPFFDIEPGEEATPRMPERLGQGGGSAIHDYLYVALAEIERRQGRRVVVLLSDGEDVHSVLRMPQVLAAARRSQAQVYWVQLWGRMRRGIDFFDSWRDPASARREVGLLEKLVREGGGRVLPISDDAEIEPAFREILSELHDQYALGYYPDPDYGDGRWRRLKVRVKPGGLRVRTREGYVDD